MLKIFDQRTENAHDRYSMKVFLVIACFVFPAFQLFSQSRVISPNGKNVIEISTGKELSYSVLYDGIRLIAPSRLGFNFVDHPPLVQDVELAKMTDTTVDVSWEPVWGRYSSVRDHYNEAVFYLEESNYPKRKFKLEVRCYDDGIAFRYWLPVISGLKNSVTEELTEFNFIENHTAWMADFGGYKSHQEQEFWSKTLDDINGEKRIGTPLLIRTGNHSFAALLEANIENWPGMYIGRNEKIKDLEGLRVRLSPPRDMPETAVKAVLENSQYTPWRVIMLADNPGKFIESEIISNLNEPCAIEDPSWIKPGLCAWDHWWSGEVKMDTRTIKQYISLASEMGWPYMLIDWQWYGQFDLPESDITKVNPDVNMEEVLAFAREKNVRCWLWLYWTDADKMYEKAFPLYEKWGIAGVKIDFMQFDDQEMVNWYAKIIEKAAEHHLMVNFHGAYKPDGIRRTWPNMMTREGVLGNEYNKWSARITPEHNTTLPFTRMLAGPMDYTPGGFLNRTPDSFRTGSPANVMTTRAQQLAMFVVYDSPIITVCDHPDHYRGKPGIEFLRDIPANWDEIRFIGGYPGEYVAIAKRAGENWYFGLINNSYPKEIELKLDFLGNGKYRAELFTDGDDADVVAESLKIESGKFSRTDVVKLKLAPGGGAAARFYK